MEDVVDLYRVKTDKRSGIVNDPNRTDDVLYILQMIGEAIIMRMENVEGSLSVRAGEANGG